MKPDFSREIIVNEVFVYRWICPVCGEDAEIRTSIAKVFLSCPICNVTYRRLGITEGTWFLLCEDNNGDGRKKAHLLPAEPEKEDPRLKGRKFRFSD